ncbi:MAG TPA: 16S rRNA (cytidine(1402)-2'-O)-methyltransferase [Gammaproteobacteria bacterium]
MVATPIGNLADIGQRALAVLGAVELVLAEDTRHSRRLLDHYAIRTRLAALHEHNERAALPGLLEQLAAGHDLALVSDAGTPLISDPGFRLVRAARAQGFQVSAVPGPCAAICALSVAGLPTDRFLFAGFLPAKAGQRRTELATLAAETATVVLYEAPRRLLETLDDLVAVFGPARRAVLARELTKLHETVLDGTLAELRERLASDPEQRLGEAVLLVAGAPGAAAADAEVRRLLRALLDEGLAVSRAAAVAQRVTGQPHRALYRLAQALHDGEAESQDGAAPPA